MSFTIAGSWVRGLAGSTIFVSLFELRSELAIRDPRTPEPAIVNDTNGSSHAGKVDYAK